MIIKHEAMHSRQSSPLSSRAQRLQYIHVSNPMNTDYSTHNPIYPRKLVKEGLEVIPSRNIKISIGIVCIYTGNLATSKALGGFFHFDSNLATSKIWWQRDFPAS